jgi:hypothetical protein
VHGKNSLSSSERTRVTKNYVELCQVGIELVKVCTEEICVDFRRNKVTEYTVRKRFARSASSRRTLGGREVFLVQKILRILNLRKDKKMQGVHGRSKYSKRSSSQGIT